MARSGPGKRLRNFVGRSLFQQLWFLPAWLGLGLAGLAIAVVPFRHIAPRLGRYAGVVVPDAAVSEADELRALEIRRTVQFAVAYAPWRADCYPQALVARALVGLYRLPFVLCLGLRRDAATGEMTAHAWLHCGSVAVTGGSETAAYSVVGVYTGPVDAGSQ